MEILCKDDVDKFFDKFEDPSYEVERMTDMMNYLYHELPKHRHTSAMDEIRQYFLKRLVMKAYRLGKEHAYADSIHTIQNR